MKVACNCQLCSKPIEFDSADAGKVAACPSCGMETQLYLVQKNFQAMTERAKAPKQSGGSRGVLGLVAAIVMVAILAVIFGAFARGGSEGGALVAGGVATIVAGVFVFVLAVLWILFPMFVYFALGRIEGVLRQIEVNTRR